MKSVLLLFIFLLSFSTYSQEQLSPEQWRADLEFLQKTIHDEYDFLFKKTTADEFDKAVKKLHDSIPYMQDHEIVVGLSKVIALFKYGHTDIHLTNSGIFLLTFTNFRTGCTYMGLIRITSRHSGQRCLLLKVCQ